MHIKFIILSALVAASTAFYIDDDRIVNGTEASEGEFPYMVSVRKNGRHTCGGTILDSTHVLTAAHCVMTVEPVSIQYGSIRLDPYSTDSIDVTFEYHEDYEGENGWIINDVAILTLESPLVFNEFVQRITLPPFEDPTPAGETGVLTGWGRNATDTEGGVVQEILQKVDLIVYADENCEAAHGDLVSRLYHICGGVPEGGKGQCSGDSGGPLAVNGVQRGIVSWSVKPCTIAPYPAVYANVARYVDWICSRADCIIDE